MNEPNQGDIPLGLIAILVGLMAAAGYFLYLFICALQGLAAQLADPAGVYDSNATMFAAVYPVFLVLAYLVLPELPDRQARLRIACRVALIPTALLPLTCAYLLPTLSTSAPWTFAGAIMLAFCGVGILPTIALARLTYVALPETRVTMAHDHYIDIDPDALAGDTRAIVAKHTGGTFHRPAAFHRPALLGDGGRLTYRDVARLIDLEITELNRLTERADAATRLSIAEFNRKRAELLASVPPDLAELTHRISAHGPVTPREHTK